MKTAVSRDLRISAIRMLCTAMVVALHISQTYEPLFPALHILTDWLNLGLVMFFCISAFLYSRRQITNVPRWLLGRCMEILVPSLIVGVATVALFALTGDITSGQLTGSLLSCLGLQVWAADSWMFVQLWFLTYLLFFYLTVPLVQKIPCGKGSDGVFIALLAVAFLVLQAVTVLIERLTGITLLSAGILIRFYLPYFMFKRFDIHSPKLRHIMYALSLLAAAAVGITCFVRYGGGFGLPAVVSELMFIYTQTLAGFVLFYWLYRALGGLKRYSLSLRLSDKYSYGVYLTHCLFIGYRTSVIRHFDYRPIGIILALLLTAGASWAVAELSRLVIPKLSRKTP